MEFGIALAKEFLAVEADRRRLENLTESLVYQRFAKELGFKVIVIGDRAFTIAKELMGLFGYRRMDYARRLLARHDVKMYSFDELLKLVGQGEGTPRQIDEEFENVVRQTFELSNHTPVVNLVFIDYKGFLVLGMYSQAENGDVVRNYLLEAERELRRKAVEGVRSEDEFLKRLKEYAPYLDRINRLIGKLPKKEQGKVAKHTLIMIFGEEIFKSAEEEREKEEALNLREKIIKTIVNLENLKGIMVKDGYVWVEGRKFLEVLRRAGVSLFGSEVKKVREGLGFEIKKTSYTRFTLIPIDLFPADFLNRVGGD